FRTSPSAAFVIIGGGFAYGVLHAAGPGHGKAVVAAYAMSGAARARRAILLSFAASMVQGLSAVALVTILTLIVRATAMTMTRYTAYLELASYTAMTLLGVWLLWRVFATRPVAAALAGGHDHGDHHHHGHGGHHAAHDHSHAEGEVCGACGHAHSVTPRSVEGKGALEAWQVVLTVGLRPCTGALILLVFSASQGLFWLGVAGTFAMALGTGLAVAILATLALYARDTAVRLAGGNGRAGAVVQTVIGAACGFIVLGFGITLLGGALAAS
ncbi:MAG: nickel/cobalt transporter, partial [Flavobacteriaceae bacterium]